MATAAAPASSSQLPMTNMENATDVAEYEEWEKTRPVFDLGKQRRLRVANIVLAVLHLATSLALYGATHQNKDRTAYPIFSTFTADPKLTKIWPSFFVPGVKKVATAHLGFFSATFLLLAAVDHAAVALPGLNAVYNRMLSRNTNFFRWIEYTFSASIMRVEIAILSGVADIHTLWCIFGLTAVTMLIGAIFEGENRAYFGSILESERIRWTTYWIGFVPHCFAWAVILCHFFRNVNVAGAPGFVWAIIALEIVLDAAFAMNLGFQWLNLGPWRDYVFGEWMFLLLSLTAKQLLAWIAYGGASR
eukprot:tig00021073_g18008.t1